MYVIKTLTTEEVINFGNIEKKYREKYLTTEEVNFGNRKYLETICKFQGGGNAQSSEAIPPLHRGPPRQDPPSPGELLFRQNSISKTRMSSVIWTLVFWPKIVNVLIFFPASTWPCSVSQWTTLRPTWLWSETYSAPTSRFNNDPKKTQPCVGLKKCVYL